MEPGTGASTSPSDRFSVLPDSRTARRVGLGLAAVTVALIVAFLAAFTLNRLAPIGNGNWRRIVDLGGESNIPTWWNATLLAIVAIAAGAASEISRVTERRSRNAWLVVAGAATYLSIDEHAGLHERLAHPVNALDIDVPTYAWLLPGSILAGVGVAVLVVAGRRLPRPLAGRLGLALAAYGFGAIGMEGINGRIRDDDDASMLYTVGLTIEESLEMAACVYAVTVIVDAYRYRSTGAGVTVEAR